MNVEPQLQYDIKYYELLWSGILSIGKKQSQIMTEIHLYEYA